MRGLSFSSRSSARVMAARMRKLTSQTRPWGSARTARCLSSSRVASFERLALSASGLNSLWRRWRTYRVYEVRYRFLGDGRTVSNTS